MGQESSHSIAEYPASRSLKTAVRGQPKLASLLRLAKEKNLLPHSLGCLYNPVLSSLQAASQTQPSASCHIGLSVWWLTLSKLARERVNIGKSTHKMDVINSYV